jgi:hypothetical protein
MNGLRVGRRRILVMVVERAEGGAGAEEEGGTRNCSRRGTGVAIEWRKRTVGPSGRERREMSKKKNKKDCSAATCTAIGNSGDVLHGELGNGRQNKRAAAQLN